MLSEYENYRKMWRLKQKHLAETSAGDSYYVYLHLSNNDGEPRYVGMGFTTGRPWDYSNRSNQHKKFSVRTNVVISGVSKNVAEFWEIHWIKALKNAGHSICNVAKGGDGFVLDWDNAPNDWLEEHSKKTSEGMRTKLTAEQRSVNSRRSNASRHPSVRSEIATAANNAMSREERCVRSAKGGRALTAEQRSINNKKVHAARSPEERKLRSALANAGNLSRSPEERSISARKSQAARTPKERSEIAKKAQAARSPETRLAIARVAGLKGAKAGADATRLRFLRIKQYWGA